MNTISSPLGIFLATLASVTVLAQPFSSGSTGAYGPLNITADTLLDIPPDGVFHCTTIDIAQNVTLRFRKNSLNTPVYLLAIGDVSIKGNIDVSGKNGNRPIGGEGGPGGFDGGAGGTSLVPPSDGHGPGGGRGGVAFFPAANGVKGGVFAAPADHTTAAPYGNSVILPLIGGSGGGGQGLDSATDIGPGGGGGGGAILIASSTKIDCIGRILARGGTTPNNGYGEGVGGGSGGAIRLVAPVITGTGTFDCSAMSGLAGPGRVRIDSIERGNWDFHYNGVFRWGKEMYVFPAVRPQLDITEAAGQTIAPGTTALVQITLPSGANPQQTIKLRATDFTGRVPVEVVVLPETGPKGVFAGEIDMSSGNPVEFTVNVTLSPDTVNRIYAWTK